MKRRHLCFFLTLLLWGTTSGAPLLSANEEAPFPGKKSEWHGFDRYDFEVAGKPVLVVAPKEAAPGKPWVWHGEFFGHKPAPDIALLGRGFHVVYMRVPDMLGCPEAVEYWNKFYQELTDKYGFAPKAALVGLSRGGLYAYNWAAANPDKVACIYGDAPVCDFKSWPGGKGKGKGSPRDWKLVLERYGFDNEDQALAYDGNPVDNLAPLAKAGVPLLHVYGDADEVVPWDENTGVVAVRYRKLGGHIELIAKPGVGHHPHGLEDSTPIIEFIAKYAAAAPEKSESAKASQEESASKPSVPEYAPVPAELVKPREGLGNVFSKLRAAQPVKIAYLGGSITAANGWRVKSREWFQNEYPNAKVSEIHAAIGGTGSDLGAFRVYRDALRYEPDLLFVEFAVNDGGAPPERIWKTMEGIVRQAWKSNPKMDICFVYTFRTGYEEDLSQGNCPRAASAMEMLADHYGIPSINFAKKIVEMEQAGKLIYKSSQPAPEGKIVFSNDGVHPVDAGHQIYTDVLADAMQMSAITDSAGSHEEKLKVPYVADNWEAAKMVPIDVEMLSDEWYELPPDSPLARRFSGRLGTIWEAVDPGAKIEFQVRGSTVRLYDLLAPDGGQVIITVDGKTREKPVPRFDSYCTYPRIATLSIAENLDPDQVHTVSVEIHPEQPDRTPVAFRLKDPEKELKEPKYQGTNVRVGQILVIGDVVSD